MTRPTILLGPLVVCFAILALSSGSLADDVKPFQVKMPRVASIAISPDGKILATGGSAPSRGTGGLNEGLVTLWDTTTADEKQTLWQSGRRETKTGFSDTANWIQSLVFSPDGKLLAAGDRRGYRVWEVSTGREQLSLEDGFSYTGAAFSPDGRTIAIPANGILDRPRGVRLVEVATGLEVARLALEGPGQIHSLAFSPDGKLLATGGIDCHVTVWNLTTRTVLFKDHVRWVLHACRFSPDGRLLVAAGEGGVLKSYEVTVKDNRQVEKRNDSPRELGPTYSLHFSAEGNKLFAAGLDRLALVEGTGQIQVWDVAAWQQTAILEGNCVAVFGDGKRIAIGDSKRGIVSVEQIGHRRQ